MISHDRQLHAAFTVRRWLELVVITLIIIIIIASTIVWVRSQIYPFWAVTNKSNAGQGVCRWPSITE